MLTRRRFGRFTRQCFTLTAAVVGLTSCTSKGTAMKTGDLTEFATRYAAAWSGKDPVAFGAFYEENGSLIVNGNFCWNSGTSRGERSERA